MEQLLSFQSISKNRSKLMGYAILGVLIGHLFVFGQISGTQWHCLTYMAGVLHTPAFIFLCGFGMFYSLSKNSNVGEFYSRRLYRFVLPYLFLAIPYFAIVDIHGHYGIWNYLGHISTASFWLHGNYQGMWYVAISLVLYAITPPLYRCVSRSYKSAFAVTLLGCTVSVAINYMLQTYAPSYWENVSIGLNKIPYFFIGMLFGYASVFEKNRKASIVTDIILSLLFFANAIFKYENFAPATFGIVRLCFFIYVVSLVFSLLDLCAMGRVISVIFMWLGKYSFELYLLHIYFWFIVRNIHSFGPVGDIAIAIVMALLFCVPVHLFIERICSIVKAVLNHA